MRWPGRWLTAPLIEYRDPEVAAVRDPAARQLLEQTRGALTELRTRIIALENREHEVTARLEEVQYKEGSTFAGDDAFGRAIVQARKMGGDGA